ncbi:hypothetical protein [Streptomyces sp. H39-S7]|uniref:hypothetical protein n=1 Tax=Streptomyces sp. H39-S7 TaxID=3004357 RepID=UPI0022AFEEF6|nr:hypothetical protein [Streptomyces sp. H39-S7]MCZ4117803.1 hypothetical protein [Streptomyces sp. H39-S7]
MTGDDHQTKPPRTALHASSTPIQRRDQELSAKALSLAASGWDTFQRRSGEPHEGQASGGDAA